MGRRAQEMLGRRWGAQLPHSLLWTPSKVVLEVDLKVRDNMFLHHSMAYEE